MVEAFVLGDADDIFHIIIFAPFEQAKTTKARIATKDDFYIGKIPTNSFDQQRQNCPRMLCPIDIARSQITDQKLIITKNIKWQKTVVIIERSAP